MNWQTRTLATFIAATVPVESLGDTNELMEAAKRIGLTEEQIDILSRRDADEKQQPAQAAQTVAEPRVGSFEAFMASFGRVSGR